MRLDELICDGVLVATPAGSTAYNLSAYGPIMPINAPLLALTPISPFRPRRWRGALLAEHGAHRHHGARARRSGRSARSPTTSSFARSVEVEISEASDIDLFMMFDPDHDLDERILSEQFRY